MDLLLCDKVFESVVDSGVLEVQEESLVFESDAQLAVLETLGDVFSDSFPELEVVWVDAFDSTDQDDKSRDLERLVFIATRLSSVSMR